MPDDVRADEARAAGDEEGVHCLVVDAVIRGFGYAVPRCFCRGSNNRIPK
jgi:hypothetical protein